MNAEKILSAVMSGANDHSIRFSDMEKLLEYLGFELRRISGSHHIYSYSEILELIDIQPDKGDSSKAKSYQVRQVREFLRRHPEVLT